MGSANTNKNAISIQRHLITVPSNTGRNRSVRSVVLKGADDKNRTELEALISGVVEFIKNIYAKKDFNQINSTLSNFKDKIKNSNFSYHNTGHRIDVILAQLELYNKYVEEYTRNHQLNALVSSIVVDSGSTSSAKNTTSTISAEVANNVHDAILHNKFQNQAVFIAILDSINQSIDIMSIINKESLDNLNKRQEKISEANDILAIMRAQYPKDDSAKVKLDEKVLKWMEKNLTNWKTTLKQQFNNSIELNQGKYEQAILVTKGWIDDENSLIQTEMVFIKKLASEFNQFVEIKNNLLDKINKSNSSIISTMRG